MDITNRLNIFYLDDERQPGRDLRTSALSAETDCVFNITLSRGLPYAANIVKREPRFEIWSLDHDIGMIGDGYEFLKEVVDHFIEIEDFSKWPDIIRVHSHNPVGADKMISYAKNVNKHFSKQAVIFYEAAYMGTNELQKQIKMLHL